MTARKDLKRRIRERQERTGETYVVARRSVLAERAPPSPAAAGPIVVVEMDDFTAEAAELGLRCTVSITRQLTAHVEPRTILARFRDILHGTSEDPAMERMRAVALRGDAPARIRRPPRELFEEMQRFEARVRVGIGGVSESGTLLACPIQGARGMVMMVCHLGFGIVTPKTRPHVVLTTGDAAFYVERVAARKLASP